jgi:hypothetical protein
MNRLLSPRAFVASLLFLIVTIIACQKATEPRVNESSANPLSDNEKSAVKNWLSAQRAVAKDTVEFNEIVKSLDWSNADKTNYTGGSSLLAIPVRKQVIDQKMSTLLAKRSAFTKDFLVILLSPQETVTQGNLIYITPAGGSNSSTASRLVADVLDKSSTNFNGTFTMMTMNTEVMYELLYKNNNRYAESKIKGAPKTEKHAVGPDGFKQTASADKTVNGEKRVNEEYCLDWYWVTFYDDGSTSWEYMFTQCGLCDANGIGAKGSVEKIKVNCGGGGGGGGGGGNACGMDVDDMHADLDEAITSSSGAQVSGTGIGGWETDSYGNTAQNFAAKAEIYSITFHKGGTFAGTRTWFGEWVGKRAPFISDGRLLYIWVTTPVYAGTFETGGFVFAAYSANITAYGLFGSISADPQYADCTYRVSGTTSISCDGIGASKAIQAEQKVAHLKAAE